MIMKNDRILACLTASLFLLTSTANASEDGFSLSVIGGYVFENARLGMFTLALRQ